MKKIIGKQDFVPNEEETESMGDLTEPQFYPDPSQFRDSLEKFAREDNDNLRKNLMCNKTTLRVLAPYLKTIYIDQKRVLESAKNLRRPKTKTKLIFHKKSKERFSSVVSDLTEKFETVVAIHETADIIKSLLRANNVVSYLVNHSRNELYQTPRHVISSTATLTWKIEIGTTMAAYAAATKQCVTSNNVSADVRFPLGVGFQASIIKYGLCVPIKTPDDKVVGVYELTRDAFKTDFNEKDKQLILTLTGWMGFAILNNNFYTSLMKQQELTDYTLQLTNHFHGGHATIDKTLSDIVIFARDTVGAERCSLYVVDRESENTITVEEYDQGPDISKILHKRRTKKIIDRNDNYLSKVLFNKEVVNKFGIVAENNVDLLESTTRSLVCVPILCKCQDIIGAIQLTNKKLVSEFEKEDEKTLIMFASFCTINLNHFNLLEKQKKYNLQTNINREMLLYHMKPCVHDKKNIIAQKGNLPEQFFTLNWYPSPDHRPRLAEYTVKMFHEILGNSFMTSNDIPNFVLMVQKCYRPVPYHNFLHAFEVVHLMAIIIKNYYGVFNKIEQRGLMLAALCHDVDHQNYENSFIHLTAHYLSSLYESSPLENHHFAVTKMIIQQCGLFKNKRAEVYNELLTEIYECIEATDLTFYFEYKEEFLRLVDGETFSFKNRNHRRLLKNMVIQTCDIRDQTRTLLTSHKITEEFYEELFQEGDLIKKMQRIPLHIMDRNKKDVIAENQVEFLDIVVSPCLRVVSCIFNLLTPMVADCKDAIHQWKELIKIKNQDIWIPEDSIVKH